METAFTNEERLHVFLWEVTKREAELCREGGFVAQFHRIATSTFAFHSIEAYINYIGGLIDPRIWEKERNHFKGRGVKGKRDHVIEKIGLTSDGSVRPLKTIARLQAIRDEIGHGKRTVLTDRVPHTKEQFVGLLGPRPEWRKAVDEGDEWILTILQDVEEFADSIHTCAKAHLEVKDPLYGERAFGGLMSYRQSSTTTQSQ